MFLSFPPPTKMFQFRGLAHLAMCQVFYLTGCPIQKSPDQILFANPRSFSQLTTSFFASKSLGIPHTPLFTFFTQRTSPIDTHASLSHLLKYVNELCRSLCREQHRGFAPLRLSRCCRFLKNRAAKLTFK